MKIIDVSLTLFTFDGIPPTEYAAHVANRSGRSDIGLLRILTDAGIEGHAFLGSAMRGASADARPLIEGLKPLLMGQDPFERERLHGLMRKWARTFTQRPVGAVDVALWDIAGKAASLPIYQLLGTYRKSIPAYASSQKLPSIQAYVEQALEFQAKGWPAYKIHPVEDWRQDMRICEAVRKAVGDDYTLMLDASFAYRYEEAVRVGLAIQDLGFHWYEDPLTEHDIYNYVKLREKLHIPIMATELPAAGFDAYATWITEKATDYLRGDVPLKGGITTMIKTAHLAQAFNMNYEIHHGGNSANNIAGLHVAMAIPNCEYFEVLLPEATHRYGLVRDISVDDCGHIQAPQGPGLGLEIDFDLIAARTTAVLR